jgi:hypothetical protein
VVDWMSVRARECGCEKRHKDEGREGVRMRVGLRSG